MSLQQNWLARSPKDVINKPYVHMYADHSITYQMTINGVQGICPREGGGEGVESIIEACPWGSGGIYKSQGRGGGGGGGGCQGII